MTVHKLTPKPEPTAFDRFWSACPKRADKVLTRQLFNLLISEGGLQTKIRNRESNELVEISYSQVDPEVLISEMQKYAKTQVNPSTFDLKDGGRWTCTPAVWLNRGRWQD